MSTQINAVIFKATAVSDVEIEIVAKTKGKKPRTYKVRVPTVSFLQESEDVTTLKGRAINFEEDGDGGLLVLPFYAEDVVLQATPQPVPQTLVKTDPRKRIKHWKKTLVTLESHESMASVREMRLMHPKGSGNGILCPQCDKKELKDCGEETIRLSAPPTIAISCVCGYSSRRSL